MLRPSRRRTIPGRPLLIDECGIGTDDDESSAPTYLRRRPREVRATPSPTASTCAGFFHWTGVDNYEWRHGFDVAFGLFDRDRNPSPPPSSRSSRDLANRRSVRYADGPTVDVSRGLR